ncbi:MAG: NAD(P)H-binding protein [Bacteroidota bacterium]
MEIIKGKKTAIYFGATGLVGKHCVRFLLQHQAYEQVVVFSRRALSFEHPQLTTHLIDFDHLAEFADHIRGNDVYISLGTTRAKAGSKEGFYKVDFTYTFEAAKLACLNDVSQLMLVSSVGADVDSIFYYSQVKGELEAAIKKLPFWAIHIFQPSVLLGERPENRWGERIAGVLGKGIDQLTGGLLTKYKPVEAEVVAKAMISAAQRLEKGIHVYPSDYLQRLADEIYGTELI